MSDGQYRGLLVIGDPHLDARPPGFRKDDYPKVILEKLEWCLDYALNNGLMPAILGDLFDKPRDNPNWILSRLIDLFHLHREVIGLYGNHDVHYNPELTEDDSLNVLVKAGRIRLVSAESPWRGAVGGRTIVVGGSSYRQAIPKWLLQCRCKWQRPAADDLADAPRHQHSRLRRRLDKAL